MNTGLLEFYHQVLITGTTCTMSDGKSLVIALSTAISQTDGVLIMMNFKEND